MELWSSDCRGPTRLCSRSWSWVALLNYFQRRIGPVGLQSDDQLQLSAVLSAVLSLVFLLPFRCLSAALSLSSLSFCCIAVGVGVWSLG